MTSTHDGSITTDLATPAKTGAKNSVCTLENGALFYTRHLSLSKPDGDLLIRPFSFELKAGEHLMIAGASGCGKSTILRASHGLWPWSSGETGVNKGTSKLIIAQKPHLPLISLKGIICYPRVSDEFNDACVAEALNKAGLGQLIPSMNDRNKDGSHWERLSGGEKQRISFARILLHRPSLLMLDEVTASLDVKAQDELYGALLDEIPQSAIISISHRPELAQYHNRHAVIENREFSFVSGPSTPRRTPAPA